MEERKDNVKENSAMEKVENAALTNETAPPKRKTNAKKAQAGSATKKSKKTPEKKAKADERKREEKAKAKLAQKEEKKKKKEEVRVLKGNAYREKRRKT